MPSLRSRRRGPSGRRSRGPRSQGIGSLMSSGGPRGAMSPNEQRMMANRAAAARNPGRGPGPRGVRSQYGALGGSEFGRSIREADRLGVARGSLPPTHKPGSGGLLPAEGYRPPPNFGPARANRAPTGGRNIGPPGRGGRGGPPMMQGGGVPPEMGPPPEMAMGPPPPALNSPASPLDMMRGADPMGGPPIAEGGGAPGEGVEELPTAIADTLLLNTASPEEALAILDQAREEILAQMMPEDPGMGGGRLDALADPMMMG